MYQFDTQYKQGAAAESYIDDVFRPHFIISRVDMDTQRLGIDRVWRGRRHNQRLTVEYKCDRTAASTGNAFVEIQSTDKAQGWALTSQAGWLVYYVPGKRLYLVSVRRLREQLPTWLARYERRQIHNNGYVAAGLLVPLTELDAISSYVKEADNALRNGRGNAVPATPAATATGSGD